MSQDSGERTYEPSDARREQFRKDGRYARAKDLGPLAATLAVVLVLHSSRHALLRSLETIFVRTLGDLDALERVGTAATLRAVAGPIAIELAAALVAGAIASVLASGAQTRFRLRWDAISFKTDKLDVVAALGRLFAFRDNAVELLLSLARAGAVGASAYVALVKEMPTLLAASRAPLGPAVLAAVAALGKVMSYALVALVVLVAIDFGVSWLRLERDLKMTRQERTDEAKKEDGDPKVKARMRARARANAKRRAISSVKNADVIVVNPTHVSVALRYGPRDPAPIVVAKGHDEIALKIRAEARRHGIPILENRPLARALDAEVAVGRPIPHARFAAVAQVLAFVYRLKKRGELGTSRA